MDTLTDADEPEATALGRLRERPLHLEAHAVVDDLELDRAATRLDPDGDLVAPACSRTFASASWMARNTVIRCADESESGSPRISRSALIPVRSEKLSTSRWRICPAGAR